MKYKIITEKEIDIDALKTKFLTTAELQNSMLRILGQHETSLINFLVEQGIGDLDADNPVPITVE